MSEKKYLLNIDNWQKEKLQHVPKRAQEIEQRIDTRICKSTSSIDSVSEET